MLMWQPMYGFASGGPLRFKRAIGHRDLFYLEDKDLEFKDVSNFFTILAGPFWSTSLNECERVFYS